MRFPFAGALAALGVLAFVNTAAAADKCAGAEDQATMTQCAGDAYKASDAKLNKLYRQITGRLKDDQDTTKLLVAAQKAWIAFRDAECKFSSSRATGGSIYPMVLAQCLDGATQARIKSLNTYLNCQEGDMGCPVPASN
jgi:uncharacterized protein YecT (DUF1311 family)